MGIFCFNEHNTETIFEVIAMANEKILVIEVTLDDKLRDLLPKLIRIKGLPYQVIFIPNSENILHEISAHMPDFIIVSADSYRNIPNEIKEMLRIHYLKHVPKMLVAQEIHPVIVGQYFNWFDDGIQKPFYPAELLSRWNHILRRIKFHPASRLPDARHLEYSRQRPRDKQQHWQEVHVKLENVEPETQLYDDIVYSVSCSICSTLYKSGTKDDFVAHPEQNRFVIITHTENVDSLTSELEKRFAQVVKQHEVPLVSLRIEVQQHD